MFKVCCFSHWNLVLTLPVAFLRMGFKKKLTQMALGINKRISVVAYKLLTFNQIQTIEIFHCC